MHRGRNIYVLAGLILCLAIFSGCWKQTGKEVVLEKPQQEYVLNVGDLAVISLDENPSTGYSWHYTISNEEVAALESESNQEAEGNAVGTPLLHTWKFKCLEKGNAEIHFKYYREWEGPKTVVKDLTYLLSVK
ncbi:hypothetical protein DCMF_20625 [Candidatus Formimonas warabiya]|uniref:Proteinase inhibitor I42 chagasin domain-containing protein n=2 Tax=Formimonas warabiya TaxID=1761012 RepID=A0A3G1KWM1_FORW1|nr:hypothetical protein DCMF_20625 [Candidatus Formimonas warabiya]